MKLNFPATFTKNFSNFIIQDDSNTILDRALEYIIPKDEVRSFHFACSGAFGKKLPIFSAEQLPLCEEKTLLLFKKKDINESEDNEIIMLLYSVDDDETLNVSLRYDDNETKSFSKDELFNYKECSYNLYYYPNSPIEPQGRIDFVSNNVKENMKVIPKIGAEKLVKKGIKAGMRETISSGLKGAVAAKLITPQLAKSVGKKAAGPMIDVAVGTGEAGIATYQHRAKEKKYEESGGVKGFSRTRANRKITKEWSSAAAGTAGGIGSAALLTAGAATAGQVSVVLFLQNFPFRKIL